MDFVDYTHPENGRIHQYASHINRVACAAKVPACALAAIVERESNGDKNARSADGGWGLCQITYGVDARGIYTATGAPMLDPGCNIEVAATYFLAPLIRQSLALRERNPGMNAISPDILFFAFIGYNAGFGVIERALRRGENPDRSATNAYGAGTFALYRTAVAGVHTALRPYINVRSFR